MIIVTPVFERKPSRCPCGRCGSLLQPDRCPWHAGSRA